MVAWSDAKLSHLRIAGRDVLCCRLLCLLAVVIPCRHVHHMTDEGADPVGEAKRPSPTTTGICHFTGKKTNTSIPQVRWFIMIYIYICWQRWVSPDHPTQMVLFSFWTHGDCTCRGVLPRAALGGHAGASAHRGARPSCGAMGRGGPRLGWFAPWISKQTSLVRIGLITTLPLLGTSSPPC